MLNNESMKMYLETILRLCKSNEKVRAVDIANQMRISKVSVCHAMWPKGDFLGVANERVERIAEEMEAAWKDRTVEKNMEM